ncbi:hypothetical protein [Streptomyces sp. MUM 2J]|uniref:hypothetical protein n=1 Tax=Streptomyces sp. MUM 2J TaxID=2791987 RepID=UPI001F03AACD|nr:hypothetical protein [Streptomyces sp. MUM 2J]MCH0563624.1 hypothetical protein [Streptomyces sp. MUM 2J]
MPVDQHSDPFDAPQTDPFEDRLSAALHQAGGTFDTNRAALAAAGAARGRRLRLQRRAAVLGGAASVALAAVGGALLVPWGGSAPASRATAVGATPKPSASTSTSASASASASATAGSTTTATATATTAEGPVSAEQMIETLKKLMPKGTFSQEAGRGTQKDKDLPIAAPYASVVFEDGKGPAAVSVSLNRVQPGTQEAQDASRCPDKVYVPYDACTTKRLDDGSVIMILQGYEYPDRRVDTKLWRAELLTPKGQQVSVMEWNSASEKDAPISRPEPPLDPEQLTRLASAPEWRTVVDTMPEPPKVTEKPGSQPSLPDVHARATLLQLLPKDLDVVDKSRGDDSEFAYAVVDDGRGRSLVQVNVQPDMRDAADALFGSGSETLSDGTRVAVHQGPGAKGAAGSVMWTVDTMRPDGRRVVISAFNAGTQQEAATRATPALTIAQMREMALSTHWFRAQSTN